MDPGLDRSTLLVGDGQQLDGISQLPGVLEVPRRQSGNPFAEDIRVLDARPEAKRG